MSKSFRLRLAEVGDINELNELFSDMREAMLAEPQKHVSTMDIKELTRVLRDIVMPHVLEGQEIYLVDVEVQAFASKFAIDDDGERVSQEEIDMVSADEILNSEQMPKVASLQRSVKRWSGNDGELEVYLSRDSAGRLRYATRPNRNRRKVKSADSESVRRLKAFKTELFEGMTNDANNLSLSLIKRGADVNMALGIVEELMGMLKARIEAE